MIHLDILLFNLTDLISYSRHNYIRTNMNNRNGQLILAKAIHESVFVDDRVHLFDKVVSQLAFFDYKYFVIDFDVFLLKVDQINSFFGLLDIIFEPFFEEGVFGTEVDFLKIVFIVIDKFISIILQLGFDFFKWTFKELIGLDIEDILLAQIRSIAFSLVNQSQTLFLDLKY